MTPEQLYRLGFSLILLEKRKKKPVDGKWSEGPRVPLLDILDGIDEGYNVGFRPGITSKTETAQYIHVIDLDIRVAEDRDEAIAKLEEIFGRKFLKECGRVISGSGGESRHFYFTMRRPMRAKTVAHSKEKFFDEVKQKMRWRWEIEVFGEGKQIVVPPSIHPDTGAEYRWLKDPDNLPELDVERLEEVLDELTRSAAGLDDEDLAPLGIKMAEARNILSNLDFETWFVERDGWRNCGMALHHEFNGSNEAYRLWTEFSKKAENFDAAEQRYQWGTFGRNDRVRPFRMASLIKEASEAEIRDVLQPDEDDAAELREARRERKERKRASPPKKSAPIIDEDIEDAEIVTEMPPLRQPDHLLTIPGILGEVVDLYNASAPRPQPQFAVHTALALGSVVLGRYYVTDMNNYTSMYFLMLGATASGKEHGLRVIQKILDHCETDLVGPTKYTSDAGVMSSLEARPKHISLCDEFGRYLGSSRSSGDANRSEANSSLMELWGRCDGTHRNKGYSTRAMSQAQKDELRASKIERPAVSFLGVSTPEKFYDAMGDTDVKDGFLNRFLVCDTEVPRLRMQRDIQPVVPNENIVKWVKNHYNPDNGGEDSDFTTQSAQEPDAPIVIPFSPKARRLLDDIDLECLKQMNRLDAKGLDGIYGRTREIIMRMSLVIAISCDCDEILTQHVKWARDYVYYHTKKTEGHAETTMGKSDTHKIVDQCADIIEKMSDDKAFMGATVKEICARCWSFRNLETRGREEVVKLLESDHGAVIRNVKRNWSQRTTKVLTFRTDL